MKMNSAPRITLDASLLNKIQIEAAFFENLRCREKNDAIWRLFEVLEKEYREKYPTPAAALTVLQPARKLYRAFGIEPTKIRPSSEALFRRVIRGKGLYRINSIVDCANYCSLKFLLPIGLYDADKVQGDICLSLGSEGAGYVGIGKEWVNVENRIALYDEIGPFGNPSSDSARTKIAENTRRVLLMLFAPHDYPGGRLRQNLVIAVKLMTQFHPGGLAVHLPAATIEPGE